MNSVFYDAIGKKVMVGPRVFRECKTKEEAKRIAKELSEESRQKYNEYKRTEKARRKARKLSEVGA